MRYVFVDKVNLTPDHAIGRYTVPEDLPIFTDHFPSFPILPGVLMVEAALQVARVLFKQPRLVLKEAKAVRYGSIIRPGSIVDIEIKKQGSEQWGYQAGLWIINTDGSRGASAMTGRFTMRLPEATQSSKANI